MRQISTYRAWVGNEGEYDYARIVAGRIWDLVDILDRMPEWASEVEQTEMPTVDDVQKQEFAVLF